MYSPSKNKEKNTVYGFGQNAKNKHLQITSYS